jgi:hypothetical protein
MKWSADITNDPAKEQAVYAELLEDEEYRGRIEKNEEGVLVLVIYGREDVQVPLEWLCALHAQFRDRGSAR